MVAIRYQKICITKYHKSIIVFLCFCVFGQKWHKVARTFVSANICSVIGVSKNPSFFERKFVFEKRSIGVYHLSSPPPPHYTTTTHPLHQISQNLPTTPKYPSSPSYQILPQHTTPHYTTTLNPTKKNPK